MAEHTTTAVIEQAVRFDAGAVELLGDLAIPESAQGIVLFAHGSGSSRQSLRNRFVAERLQEAGLATLLMDLLTEDEEAADRFSGYLRFDIGVLANRLLAATDWLAEDERTTDLKIGYFGASTGGGAALVAATKSADRIGAVVSRGGRPDLAGDSLPAVRAATLLVVGGDDDIVMRLNREALAKLGSPIKRLEIVPGASHLFEEPGTLEEVARLAAEWFTDYLSLSAEPRTAR